MASPDLLPAQGPEEPSPSVPGSHRAAFPWHLPALTTAALEPGEKIPSEPPWSFRGPRCRISLR